MDDLCISMPIRISPHILRVYLISLFIYIYKYMYIYDFSDISILKRIGVVKILTNLDGSLLKSHIQEKQRQTQRVND